MLVRLLTTVVLIMRIGFGGILKLSVELRALGP